MHICFMLQCTILMFTGYTSSVEPEAKRRRLETDTALPLKGLTIIMTYVYYIPIGYGQISSIVF